MRRGVVELVHAQVKRPLGGLPDEVVRGPGIHEVQVVCLAQAVDDGREMVECRRPAIGAEPRESHVFPMVLQASLSPKP